MSVTWIVASFVSLIVYVLPDSADKFGWGLRVQPLDMPQPLLAQECISDSGVRVILLNHSKGQRQSLPLEIAQETGDLSVTFRRPDGTFIRAIGRRRKPDPLDERKHIPAGGLVIASFGIDSLGHHDVQESGVYELRTSLKTLEGVVVSPVVKLTVIDPTDDAILVSCAVPTVGPQMTWPEAKRDRGSIQQIKIENRTWLFYRRFLSDELGGKANAVHRLAELPGKVEMKVEGVYGDYTPITITYKDSKSPTGTTKLVIHSVNGRQWTEADEAALQLRLKKAPPPKP